MTRPFARPDVAKVFKAYPGPMRRDLMRLREMVFDTAARLHSVGPLEETLRWGQYAMYFHCWTSLVDDFRAAFPDPFTFEGNRAIVFDAGDRVPVRQLAVCISAALTYHRERPRGRSRRRRA
jgi:hypothetical protein